MSVTSAQRELRLVLYGVSWLTYEGMLAALDQHRLRHAYDRGDFEIMSPSREHDRIKRLIGRMIEALSLELGIPIQSVGSMTLLGIPIQSVGSMTVRRPDLERGIEPDESYYVANEPLVRDKEDFDPARDPPPDLAVEIDLRPSSLDRMSIYAALGVPEIWRYDGTSVTFFERNKAGQYEPTGRSAAFPLLHSADVWQFLGRRGSLDETAWIRSFMEWVRGRAEASPDS